ncbi:ssr2551 [Synechocystis sp. PCC 6803]|jgi:hypothetical protein|uniref:Ssr2551 protein n=1 Tax=Synechocystis sp. (strain ATCC 27184 / PCC 6803 / Kazusa) TaxID=1111708 RepID=P73959_SYNY3|nr:MULTISPECIES: DUF3288 family protein [unclassified Synechocystis]BAM51785.1 hypothetical protein BEST7613_2854 [Synechocystis sp. PCC 6803] [Bacillus subtilis BEST7613]AGF51714.1 hypothetical protein MYO_114630 [Synechocystis sp. PCC 6803]ALJ67707.1 hypothetical protein AOY38_07500 [Synechocystis sp. PCC 6803]AVP89541.1 DUF3288 domain-containing protein [Synechocystis sp. IPPAS B-1465]MBD2619502.1 DUF3288 family protein [Synechocystis sp. FACHB-898]
MAIGEQTHPQASKDQAIVDRLLQSPADTPHLLSLARLRIRYKNFPGARSLQRDLDTVLQQWHLTEEELFAQTRALYASGAAHAKQSTEEQQDWS